MTMAQFYAYPNAEYLFVGTVIENTEDPDQNLGRILVFDLKESNKCELVESIQMPGVVYNLKPFQNSVIACVNGSVSLCAFVFILCDSHPFCCCRYLRYNRSILIYRWEVESNSN